MNFEDNKLSEKKQVTPSYVLDVCERFANALTRGQWSEDENREVSISRSFTEVFGQPTKAVINGEPIREIKLRTEVLFKAEKEVIKEYDNGEVVLDEFYVTTAKVSEIVHHSQLPDYVLESLAEIIEEEGDEEEDVTEGQLVDLNAKVTDQILNSFVFEREHEIGYTIDDEGDLSDYYIVIRYNGNKATITESRYGWNDDDLRGLQEPAGSVDKRVVEWKSLGQTELEEADIAKFLNSFERIIQDVVDMEEFSDLSEELDTEVDEHHRRALGIIAMTAAGFKHIKL